MNATPVYTGSGQAIGFDVYRQLPNGTTPLVATGNVTAQDSYSATVSGRSVGTYQLQVYNYWPGVSISYGVSITGLAGPAHLVSGNEDSGHAVVLTSAQPGANSTLTGRGGEALDFYFVTYPGSISSFALAITYESTGGADLRALGFKVYDGATLVATVNPSDDGEAVRSGAWGYQNAQAKTFGIQVFNYAPGAAATYTLYQIDAR